MTDVSELHLFLKVSIDSSTQSPLVGFTFVDSFHHTLHVGQFHTSDSYSHLTDLLTLQPASSITLALDRVKIHLPTAEHIKALLTSSPSSPPPTLRESKASEFRPRADTVDDLERLARRVADVHSVKDCHDGLAAAGAAIRALHLLSDEAGLAQWSIRSFHLREFMAIDPQAAAALNLFPVAGDADRHMSLFGLLNKGRTAMSARLLTRWLRQPLTSLPLIQRRQRLLSIFCDSASLRSAVREQHLHRLPDYHTLLRQFTTGKARLQHIVQLWQALARLPALVAELETYDGEGKEQLEAEFTVPLRSFHGTFLPLDGLVHSLIDMDAASTGYTYVINHRIQPGLLKLVRARDEAEAAMEADKDAAERHLGLAERISIVQKGEKTVERVLRVNRSDERVLRGKAGYTILSTNKDGVKFVTRKFKDAAKAFADAQAEYEREERALIARAVETVATYATALESLIGVVGELDLLAALAHVCVNAPTPYVEPVVTAAEDGWIEMRQARHPCMEVMDGVHFIPNDVRLQRGTSHLQIITGPNMSNQHPSLCPLSTPRPALC